MKKVASGLLLVLFVASAWAGNGESAGDFLTLGVSARASGMGEAYTAIAEGAEAITWNPAGLTKINQHAMSLTHTEHLANSSFDYFAYGQRLGNGAIGISAHYFYSGKLTKRDAGGNATGTFAPNDLATSIGYAHEWRGYTWGLAGKFIRSEIVDSASTMAGDLGVLSPLWFKKWQMGLAFTNWGGQLKYVNESEDLPAASRLGVRYLVDSHLQIAADAVLPASEDTYGAVGAEYRLPTQGMAITLRAGYSTRTSDVQGFTGFTFGMGFGWKNLDLDYGFVPYGDIDNSHRASLSFRF